MKNKHTSPDFSQFIGKTIESMTAGWNCVTISFEDGLNVTFEADDCEGGRLKVYKKVKVQKVVEEEVEIEI